MRCSSTSPQVVTTENVSKASTGVVPKHKDDILIIFEAPAHNSVTDAQRIFHLPIQHFIEVWELKAQLSEVMHYLNLVGYTWRHTCLPTSPEDLLEGVPSSSISICKMGIICKMDVILEVLVSDFRNSYA